MKNKIKHKNMIEECLFSFMILLLLPAGAPANTPKTAELRNSMSEISLLHGKIVARQAQAFELCEKLKGTMKQLEAEIKIEKQSLKTNSYREAIGSPRIDYNIKLIQKLLAYISALDAKIRHLRIGTEELKFLYRQAEDDLKILETLNDMEIQKLMDQIHQTCKKYHSEANELQVDVSGMALLPPEVIWHRAAGKE